MHSTEIHFRLPRPEDGVALHTLIAACPPLDTNSVYCNLLQCTHFSETALAAETAQGELIGFISGYRPPMRLDTLFVWQVALHPKYRGQGIAQAMLQALVERTQRDLGIAFIETTISPGNLPSEGLFASFFATWQLETTRTLLFSRKTHFADQHEDEVLWRAGPLPGSLAVSTTSVDQRVHPSAHQPA
jgi:L-2,4-diaminobutyric acid acetyltransferase